MTMQERGDNRDNIFCPSLKHFIGVRPESIRHGAVGSPSFQVAIVDTHLTGLWLLVEGEQPHVKGRQTWRKGGGRDDKQRQLENKDKVLL